MREDLHVLLVAAEGAAKSAGALLRSRPKRVDHKGAVDLVTEVDLASEERIRRLLEPHGIPVQGEEAGGATTGVRWVVDPLDGTTNFVHGYPAYCVSVALVDGDLPVLGCIYDPLRDLCFSAARGHGAHVDAERLRVSETRELADALGVTGFPYDRRERADFYLGHVKRVLQAGHGVRRSGSACWDLATLAAGQCDFFWEYGLKPWDTAAGAVLVEEAGGRVTRLDGGPWNPDVPEILATNGWLHDAVARLLAP